MAKSGRKNAPKRTLAGLAVLVIALYGLLLGVHTWGTAKVVPKLGLDLEGGTQMILDPVLVGSETVTQNQLNQARDIISQRVDANGISGAEVTTQGGRNIVVSMPGVPDKATEDAIRKPSQMRFRPVLAAAPGSPAPAPTATGPAPSSPAPSTSGATGRATPGGTSSTGATKDGATSSPPAKLPTASPSASSKASASASASAKARSALPQSLLAQTTAPTPPATAQPSGSVTAPPSGTATAPAGTATTAPAGTATTAPAGTATTAPAGASATPKNPSDLAWITPDVAQRFQALNCAKKGALDGIVDDESKPLVTCSQDEKEKFILGPVEIRGDEIKDASAGYQTLPNGQQSTTVEIALSFNGPGAQKFAAVTKRLVSLPDPRNRFAVTLDSQVITAPVAQAEITNGLSSITGNFTLDSARQLAQQLKFGALPLSFQLQTREEISPTLGSEQLRLGLLAGLIGLLLVVFYSLFQYRALGFVTVASLVIASALTYVVVTLLGWSHNYRLDMAGVTGLIVAIGVTADSFIVYFERVRDEVREGRPLRAAVEAGWARARRTVFAADGVNFLAAVILYVLATSNVRGFAFTLGLTTIIDLVIVTLFTHPVVALLARTEFFGGGHRWSGLDPERLGAKTVRYAGRGRVTIAQARRAASEGSSS